MLRRVALVFMMAMFVAFFVVIVSTKERQQVVPPMMIPENHLLVEDLYLIHAMAGDKGYATLHAENAYVNNNTSTITLQNPVLTLKDAANDLSTQADSGLFVLNESLTTTGNVKGVWNELSYIVAPDGSFVYDFTTNKGVASDNVTASNRVGSFIRSGKLVYDGMASMVTFEDGVEMFMAEKL
ncbi:MAG: hypothetical protein LBV04_09495 [Deferribacteraceae bacterium]|jgi:hypothetical protein|nr:hypothetical protein [Deferribacteraceae bacterium]